MSRGSNERKCILCVALDCFVKRLKVALCICLCVCMCMCVREGIVKDRLRCTGSDESLAKERRVESVETKR